MKSALIFSLFFVICTGAGSASNAQSAAPATGGTVQSIGALDAVGGGSQVPLFGGVPDGKASEGVIPLSLADALSRGLKFNLAALTDEQALKAAHGARLRVLSDLLPKLSASASDQNQQINLAAFGFSGFPGINPIVGPFNVFDARLVLSQPILDLRSWNRSKAEAQNYRAEEHSLKNTRDLVVLACGSVYLQAATGKSRIAAARAQLETARTLRTLAADRKTAGLAAGIDVLRAQVQMQAQEQRLIVAENEFAKQKLIVARAIGLPLGQEFNLTDDIPYTPIPVPTLEAAVQMAYRARGDYLAAVDRVKAAELQKKAAIGGGLPSIGLDADYALSGQRIDQNHGTFAVAATLKIPIFQGGKVRGEVIESDAALRRRQIEADELRARIYYEIRTAFLDLKSAEDRVKVAQSAQALAEEQVRESRDRFAAGVANTIEVVQAQEALATASENYISGLFAFNLAKAALARILGVGENAYQQFLGGKP